MKEIEQIQEIINGMKLKNIQLMKKPSKQELQKLSVQCDYRCLDDLSTAYVNKEVLNATHGIWHEYEWHFPNENIRKALKDDVFYKVWYLFHDRTGSYSLHYIEEVPEEKRKLIKFLKDTIKSLEN